MHLKLVAAIVEMLLESIMAKTSKVKMEQGIATNLDRCSVFPETGSFLRC
jgi:hypothetical protein